MELLDFGDYPEILTHGVAAVHIVALHAHLLMFRWKRFEGIWRPVIVANVIRPVEGLTEPLPHKFDLARTPMEATKKVPLWNQNH